MHLRCGISLVNEARQLIFHRGAPNDAGVPGKPIIRPKKEGTDVLREDLGLGLHWEPHAAHPRKGMKCYRDR